MQSDWRERFDKYFNIETHPRVCGIVLTPKISAVKSITLGDFISDLLTNQAKAFGGCELCYGKGYATYIKPGMTASSDFPDHGPLTRSVIEKPKPAIQFCKCDRGVDLEKWFESQRQALLEEVEREVIGKHEVFAEIDGSSAQKGKSARNHLRGLQRAKLAELKGKHGTT